MTLSDYHTYIQLSFYLATSKRQAGAITLQCLC